MSTAMCPSLTALRAAVNQASIEAANLREAPGGATQGAAALARQSQLHAQALRDQVAAELHAQQQALAAQQAAVRILPAERSLPPGSLLSLSA